MAVAVPRVLSIGETLIDLSARPGGEPGSYLAHPGGSPLNVAVGVARLGTSSALGSPRARDGFAAEIRDFLAAEGVDLSFAPAVAERTTLAAATLRDGEPAYSFYPEPAPPGSFEIASRIAPEDFSVVHAGSIGLLEPDVHAQALALFGRGGLHTVDPNVRPALVGDPDGFRQRTEELMSLAAIAKLSIEDLEFLAPGESEADAVGRYLRSGCGTVVVTAAGAGVRAYGDWGQAEAPVSGLPVIDTTGGGDATMAALLAVLSHGLLPRDSTGWERTLRFAMAVAGLTCTRPGGATAMPFADEVEAIAAWTPWS
jgi:fructokinase